MQGLYDGTRMAWVDTNYYTTSTPFCLSLHYHFTWWVVDRRDDTCYRHISSNTNAITAAIKASIGPNEKVDSQMSGSIMIRAVIITIRAAAIRDDSSRKIPYAKVPNAKATASVNSVISSAWNGV